MLRKKGKEKFEKLSRKLEKCLLTQDLNMGSTNFKIWYLYLKKIGSAHLIRAWKVCKICQDIIYR